MSPQRRNLLILLSGMIVVMLSFGMIIPILPFYVESLGASGRELGMLMSTFAFMQLIFSPIWGELSDRVGRKPMLLVGILGNGLAQLFFGLSTELWMMFVARALSGMLSSATMPAALAFISDTTTDEERSSGMGILSAAMGTGMVLGPGLGGWLARGSLSLPFFVAAGLSFGVLLLAYFFLPESLPAERRSHNTGRLRGLDVRGMWRALHGPLGYPLFLSFLMNFALTNFEGVFGLYALHRYGYGATQVGTVLMLIGLASALIQGFLTGPLSRRWGDHRVIQGSLLVSAVGFFLMLTANTFVTVVLTTGFFAVGNAMLRPGVSTIISKKAGRQQGAAMGLNNAFMSLGRIVGPTWAGLALDFNLFLPYVSGGIVMALSLLTSMAGLADERDSYGGQWAPQKEE
ncbi:MAG: MFS transporter [Chloroflexi bacterium]|nr:MFS transporter [Chloroflexota bacterium]